MPITEAPLRAATSAALPVPQPTSRTRSPARGASAATAASAAGTIRAAVSSYAPRFQSAMTGILSCAVGRPTGQPRGRGGVPVDVQKELVVVHGRTDTADVLSLVGDLDGSGAPRFVSQAADALRRGARRLVIELDGVPFVDSAGLAALLNVLRRVRAADAVLVLVGLQPQVQHVLDQTHLGHEFAIAATLSDAEGVLANGE